MSLNEHNYDEKRDFIRMKVDTPVWINYDGQRHPGRGIDLSSTGLQLETQLALPEGSAVEVEVPSEHAELRGLTVEGVVVRSEARPNGQLRIGLSITRMR